ncbi:hypothetical protein VTK26DRAFT_4465 [Humicola hyalothermophila]
MRFLLVSLSFVQTPLSLWSGSGAVHSFELESLPFSYISRGPTSCPILSALGAFHPCICRGLVTSRRRTQQRTRLGSNRNQHRTAAEEENVNRQTADTRNIVRESTGGRRREGLGRAVLNPCFSGLRVCLILFRVGWRKCASLIERLSMALRHLSAGW